MAAFKALFSVFLIAVAFENKGAEAYDDCPWEFESFGDSCYWLSSYKETYEQARDDCQSLGSFMAVPLSAEENSYINGMNWSKGDRIWLGCDDLETEGNFVCQDSTPSDFSPHWRRREPARGTKKNCAIMGFDSFWAAVQCNGSRYYVCKRAK